MEKKKKEKKKKKKNRASDMRNWDSSIYSGDGTKLGNDGCS